MSRCRTWNRFHNLNDLNLQGEDRSITTFSCPRWSVRWGAPYAAMSPLMYYVTQVENVHNWKINIKVGCLWGSSQAFRLYSPWLLPLKKRNTKIHVPHLDLVACSRHFYYQTLIHFDKWKVLHNRCSHLRCEKPTWWRFMKVIVIAFKISPLAKYEFIHAFPPCKVP